MSRELIESDRRALNAVDHQGVHALLSEGVAHDANRGLRTTSCDLRAWLQAVSAA